MMMIQPRGWPRPRGYSNGAAASGRVVCVAGQVGWDPVTERFRSDEISEQALQALRNVVIVLEAANATPADIVRLTWYVTDRDEYVASRNALGEAYRATIGSHYPAMSVVVVAGLLEPRAKVEIEATAVVPNPV